MIKIKGRSATFCKLIFQNSNKNIKNFNRDFYNNINDIAKNSLDYNWVYNSKYGGGLKYKLCDCDNKYQCKTSSCNNISLNIKNNDIKLGV